jgi:4,5-DOPA dioxygenase extradiol
MPVAFLGHGNPMNALERNRYTDAWRSIGERAPRPRAILAISAHWYINATAVTAMRSPKTIHDFYGFPDDLFAVEYPAPGDPEFAQEVVEIVRPVWVGLDHDSWGLDHGTWSVLVHPYPDADVPVVQLSVNATESFEYHLGLGARLAPLADDGVLVLASGNVVHNLRLVDRSRPEAAYDWAQRFDDLVAGVMTTDPASLPSVQHDADYALAVPTPDHFIPLLYVAGVAAARQETAHVLVDGYAMGSLSMTCFTLGRFEGETNEGPGAPRLPDVPPDETNV